MFRCIKDANKLRSIDRHTLRKSDFSRADSLNEEHEPGKSLRECNQQITWVLSKEYLLVIQKSLITNKITIFIFESSIQYNIIIRFYIQIAIVT